MSESFTLFSSDFDQINQENMGKLLVDNMLRYFTNNIFRKYIEVKKISIKDIIYLINLCTANNSFKKEDLRALLLFDDKTTYSAQYNILLCVLGNMKIPESQEYILLLIQAIQNSGALSENDMINLLLSQSFSGLSILEIVGEMYYYLSDQMVAEKNTLNFVLFLFNNFSIEHIGRSIDLNKYEFKYLLQYSSEDFKNKVSKISTVFDVHLKQKKILMKAAQAIKKNDKINFFRSEVKQAVLEYLEPQFNN